MESVITSFDQINEKLTDLFEKWVEENNRLFACAVWWTRLASPQSALPTRSLDVASGWFAVHRKFIEGLPETRSEIDGRLFAIDITDV